MKKDLVKKKLLQSITDLYNRKGQSAVFDWVRAYNDNHIEIIPYLRCDACDCDSPSIDNTCVICGQETQAKKPTGLTKIVKVIVTRTYTKSTSVLITVDETMTKKEISDFVAFDTNTNRKIEIALERVSLDSGEDDLQYIENP